MTSMNPDAIARQAFETHRRLHPLEHYTGILTLYGEARRVLRLGDDTGLERLKEVLEPFIRGEREFNCNYLNYRCGGVASARLWFEGRFPEARDSVIKHARMLMEEAPRGERGAFTHPKPPEGRIFVDVAFAVTPFLVYAGRAAGEESWIEEGFQQTRNMVELLMDDACGLLHQAKNFRGEGHLTEDHWSRGNGWALFTLAGLVEGLEDDDPWRADSASMMRALLEASLRTQDAQGLWHQEMTRDDSYVETSGSALILFALGVALERGILSGDPLRSAFVKGLKGLLGYIALDGSIHNTCRGCLCPGEGRMEDYMNRPPLINDCHAFGAVSLAFGQGAVLGVTADDLTEDV